MKRQVLTLLALLCNQITALNSRFIAEDEKDYYGVDSSIERFFSATVQPVFEADQMMDRYRRSTNPPITAPAHHSHTNNWAVLVCTSRFWFNYRHIANTLSIYRTVKRLGIPDSNIILMLADDVACNPRNRYPATVFNNRDRKLDLYGGLLGEMRGGTVEVDYRGYDVTVENFIRLLTDRLDPDTPRSKRLLSDDRSNILIYMTGHGGDEFLKFQDSEEISSRDLGDAFQQMFEKKRYHEMLFIVDTCQANTLYTQFYSPNILASGSSSKGQNSYSHSEASHQLGVSVIDRYTYYLLDFMERSVTSIQSRATLADLFNNAFKPHLLGSDFGVRKDLFGRDVSSVLITDFFGNVPSVQLIDRIYDLSSVVQLKVVDQQSTTMPPKVAERDADRPATADSTTNLLIGDLHSALSMGSKVIDGAAAILETVISRNHKNFEMLRMPSASASSPLDSPADYLRLESANNWHSIQLTVGMVLLSVALLISWKF